MINKELKNEAREIENLTADDEKLRRMLGGLKKVGAPKDFDFHLKARIANARPEDLRQPQFLPWLRYVLPLGLIVLFAGFAFFNLSFPAGNQTGSDVAADLPPIQNEAANALPETPSKIIVEEPVIASVPANKTIESLLTRSNNNTPENKAKTIAYKNSPTVPNNKRENDPKRGTDGSRDEALKDAPVLFEKKPNSNSGNAIPVNAAQAKIPLQEILARIGIEADFSGGGWKITSVKDKSPAILSDMKVGDLIEAIDDKKLTSDMVFEQAFTGKVFRIVRDGKQMLIELSVK